jgi:hypothetical protein
MFAVLMHLTNLLVGFIGEELTLRLTCEVWTGLLLPAPVQSGTLDGQEAAS